nr:hypothetical protein [Actinomycetales bacterium]
MAHIVNGLSGRVRFTVPDGWAVQESPRPEVESLAYLEGPEGSFAPNAVLTLNEYEGGISEFMVNAVDGLLNALEDVFVIDIDAWSPAMRADAGFAGTGRMISYTHRSPETGARVRATEWLLAGSGLAVQLTTSAGVGQWPVFGDTFMQIADSLEFTRGDRLPAANPIPATALDEPASAAAGIEMERIHGLAAVQDYPWEEGSWLTGSAVALFAELAQGGRVGRFMLRGAARELEQLSALGLVEGSALTESGDGLADFLREPSAAVRIGADREEQEAAFQAWIHGPAVLIVADPFGEPEDPTVGRTNLMVAPLVDLSTLMARWVGLQPAWNLPIAPTTIDGEGLATSATGRPGLPEDANPALRALWEEPWTVWHLFAQGPESEVGPVPYLNGGRSGHLIMVPDEEGLNLFPAKSRTVFDNFEEVIQASIYGRIARIA